MATVSGNTLTVTGSTQGSISITIQDSYSPAETITVPINVGASTSTSIPSLPTVSAPQNVSVVAGMTTNTKLSSAMSGSTAPYTITTEPQGTIATAVISGNVLEVTGIGKGTTTAVVQDSSTTSQTTTFNITVSPQTGSNTTY